MSQSDSHDPEDRFIEAWKEWARRPPNRSPAEAAAAVSRRLNARRERTYWWALAAAALTMAIALAVHWSNLARRAGAPGANISRQEAAPLGSGEVLIWLDEKTPLYMNFQPPADGQASENKS